MNCVMKKNFIRILYIATLSHCHIVTFSQNLGIGNIAPAGKVHITGSSDISQLIIDANSTQNNLNPLIKLRMSDGTDLLWIHTDDPSNVFVGLNTGRVNNKTNGVSNTFIGRDAGYSNSTGHENSANGYSALYSNTTGFQNTANGAKALYFNTTGY